MARKPEPEPELDIPIIVCESCKKRPPMSIKAIVPHLLARNGSDVEYVCSTCGATERRTVKPT